VCDDHVAAAPSAGVDASIAARPGMDPHVVLGAPAGRTVGTEFAEGRELGTAVLPECRECNTRILSIDEAELLPPPVRR
jgi:hypothetical protein